MNLPVITLRDLVVMPGMLISFDVKRQVSEYATAYAARHDSKVFLTCQKDPTEDNISGTDQVERFGTIAFVKQMIKLPDGLIRVLVEGSKRAELISFTQTTPCIMADVNERPFVVDLYDNLEEEAMIRTFKEVAEKYAHYNHEFAENAYEQFAATTKLTELIPQAYTRIPLPVNVKQDILNCDSLRTQFIILLTFINHEIALLAVQAELGEKVKAKLDGNQKEYVLREQMKVIRTELGEDELSDADNFRAALKKLKASKEVKSRIEKEINRFAAMPSGSQEGTVSRTYIETLLDLPWNKQSKDRFDIALAEQILNEDHYGMEKIKERILEHLAVRTFTGESGGTILCLVGPPGTGKTSIARSVARALDKKYVRVSLGGVHDEAEIRGHRRTYIGAMPGCIANGLRQAGVCNPLMLLDEIDKVSADYKGDTSSALLEVLDGEQNVKFADHYVEIPIDLSHVMFIATANTTETIPRPLLDRMEIIEVTSYTENEKFHIAEDYLVEKQRKKNGLTQKQITFAPEALKKIIHSYTREAGVRNLERRIGDICRKAAREILEGKARSVKVTEKNLTKYLGKEKILFDTADKLPQVGVARGLAWTSVGGDTLEIEVNVMPGDGKLQLTGKLGDVMKESAQAGLTYIRSISEAEGIAADFFDKHDMHLHIPEGAVPKDGPSAGITMATAMLSAITGRSIRADLAMTGEITLRGRILPVGGLKEKLLAAKMADLKLILVPKKNRPDILELSEEITSGLDIRYVSQMKEVIKIAFTEQK